jgi:predicted RNA methylase
MTWSSPVPADARPRTRGVRGRNAVLRVVGLLTLLPLWCAGPVRAELQRPTPNLGRFEPSPIEVVERMLQLANVTQDDVVYDLGSGDGRIVILAARRYGARGVGVEIDPQLVWFARRDAARNQVDHLVTFVNADALAVDVSGATVVTLFLTRQANLLLRPKLLSQLRRGGRVVSHWHDMGDWAPDYAERFTSADGVTRMLYLWRIWR